MAFTYQDMGQTFHTLFSVFSVMASEIFSCCFLLILLCNRQNIAKYNCEAYRIMGVPIINL